MLLAKKLNSAHHSFRVQLIVLDVKYDRWSNILLTRGTIDGAGEAGDELFLFSHVPVLITPLKLWTGN